MSASRDSGAVANTSPVLGSIRSVVSPEAAATRSPWMKLLISAVVLMALLTVCGGRRDVERRVAVEEARGLQPEGQGVHRHHRPLLGAGDVGDAENVPAGDIGVLGRDWKSV